MNIPKVQPELGRAESPSIHSPEPRPPSPCGRVGVPMGRCLCSGH